MREEHSVLFTPRVAIIGGGLTGCEIAYELALMGKHPVIIEMQDDILTDKHTAMANTQFLRDAFDYYGVSIYTNAKTLSISERGVDVEYADLIKTIPADTVIASIGYVNGSRFEGKGKHIHCIGDCEKIGNLKNAIWGANDIALELNK